MFRFAFETMPEKNCRVEFNMYRDLLSHRILFVALLILYCQQLTRHQIFHESNEEKR